MTVRRKMKLGQLPQGAGHGQVSIPVQRGDILLVRQFTERTIEL